MTESESDSENAGHEELLRAVAGGWAKILSDATLPEGRFQLAATVLAGGREYVLTNWVLNHEGNWLSRPGVLLEGDAPSRLIELLHSSGNAPPLSIAKR
jgi:hypothetical protein